LIFYIRHSNAYDLKITSAIMCIILYRFAKTKKAFLYHIEQERFLLKTLIKRY